MISVDGGDIDECFRNIEKQVERSLISISKNIKRGT